MRLDLYLTSTEYCESRNKAASLIRSGCVSVNGKNILKPSFEVKSDDFVSVITEEKQYVARSAKKLLTAISRFGLDFNGKVAVDLGASTGGFCEVMLDNGVKHIYAVDIGTNQLHEKIKSDPRVQNTEHTNARFITAKTFDKTVDIITCDLSFISLKLILGAVYSALKQNGEFICLIKPQFEVGTRFLNKNGVVRDLRAHEKAVSDIIELSQNIGFNVKDVCYSGLSGESGNREYLMYAIKENSDCAFDIDKIKTAVSENV